MNVTVLDPKGRGGLRHYKVLTVRQWRQIWADRKQGVSVRRLAREHGVSHTWLNRRIDAETARFEPSRTRERRPRNVVAE